MLSDTPLRIVAIGGGTGLSTLLDGLKRRLLAGDGHDSSVVPELDVTAVVTVTDDGGSSGRLRRDFDVLPPGDIRNCMVALSADDALLSKLFQYRFPAGRGLKDHSFGNLFLTALTNITGDFANAVKLSSEILASVGRIYPSTGENVRLRATLSDGSHVLGETLISRSKKRIEKVELVPESCRPLPETLLAIEQADLITLGPGSLFTSIVPNMLVEGIPAAIRKSRAVKVCLVNLMSQPGETTGFTASDHVKAIHDHAGMKLIDVVVVNTAPISPALKRRYAAHRAMPVQIDNEELEKQDVDVIRRDLVARSQRVRHDPDATAAIVTELAALSRRMRNSHRER